MALSLYGSKRAKCSYKQKRQNNPASLLPLCSSNFSFFQAWNNIVENFFFFFPGKYVAENGYFYSLRRLPDNKYTGPACLNNSAVHFSVNFEGQEKKFPSKLCYRCVSVWPSVSEILAWQGRTPRRLPRTCIQFRNFVSQTLFSLRPCGLDC